MSEILLMVRISVLDIVKCQYNTRPELTSFGASQEVSRAYYTDHDGVCNIIMAV